MMASVGDASKLRMTYRPTHTHIRTSSPSPHAGRGMMASVGDANKLRMTYPALRYGWSNCIHEDRINGVMG